ncbi:MAG: hypothetical protein RR335_11675 [Eubacterium sp.]
MINKIKTGLFPFEEEKEILDIPVEKQQIIQKIWEEDEAAFMNYIIGLLQ